MLKVYCTRFTECLRNEQYENHLKSLPQEITTKILKFVRWQDAHAALLGKLLLRHGLSDMGYHTDFKDLRYTAYNRPYIENCSIDFSISHSGEYVLCALSTSGRVGIDIEHIRPVKLNDFESQWTAQELENIRIADDSLRQFYNYWTRKEAVIKANGKGLSLSLAKINVTSDVVSFEDKSWNIKELFIADDYCAHLVTDEHISIPVTINRIDFFREH